MGDEVSEAMKLFQSSSKSLMTNADILFDNLEYEYDQITPMALGGDSDSDDEHNVKEQREYFRRRSLEFGGSGELKPGDLKATTPTLDALLSNPTVLLTDTSETTISENEVNRRTDIGSRSEGDLESDQESSDDSLEAAKRVVMVIEDVAVISSVEEAANQSYGNSAVVHVGDIESDLDSEVESLFDDQDRDYSLGEDQCLSAIQEEARLGTTSHSFSINSTLEATDRSEDVYIDESAAKNWKTPTLSSDQTRSNLSDEQERPEKPARARSLVVAAELDSFVAELDSRSEAKAASKQSQNLQDEGEEEDRNEDQTPRRAFANQYLSSTPNSVRDFWRVANDGSPPSVTARKEQDLELQRALASSPVSARRDSFLSAISTSPSQDKDLKNDPAFSTPISARKEALLAVIAARKEQSASSFDESLKAASLTPVHARQASLAAKTDRKSIFRENSWTNEAAIKAAAITPVTMRRAALTAEIEELARNSTSESGETSPSSESDFAVLAASANPVNARRALLQAETSSIFRKPESFDAGLLAASSTPVNSRRATLATDRELRKTRSGRDAQIFASSTPLHSRREALAAGLCASRSFSTSFETDEALKAASSIQTRRALLAQGIHRSSRLSLTLQKELEALKQQSLVSSRKTLRNRRARNDRLFFQLNQRRGGMSDKDYLKLDDFLPHQRVLLELKASSALFPDIPEDSFDLLETHEPEVVQLRVWLTCPQEKVFEIVTFEMKGDMTVEDVVEEACALALDPILSEQHYVSLCNKYHEIVQPSNSVKTLIRLSEAKKYQTLMAVPFGSTAAIVRAIRRVLEKTKQVKRLLKKEEPFTAHAKKEHKTRHHI